MATQGWELLQGCIKPSAVHTSAVGIIVLYQEYCMYITNVFCMRSSPSFLPTIICKRMSTLMHSGGFWARELVVVSDHVGVWFVRVRVYIGFVAGCTTACSYRVVNPQSALSMLPASLLIFKPISPASRNLDLIWIGNMD